MGMGTTTSALESLHIASFMHHGNFCRPSSSETGGMLRAVFPFHFHCSCAQRGCEYFLESFSSQLLDAHGPGFNSSKNTEKSDRTYTRSGWGPTS